METTEQIRRVSGSPALALARRGRQLFAVLSAFCMFAVG
jgi:hypothetical protein